MNIAAMIISFFVSSWMIIHLGINPERGGRPPRESIIIRTKEVVNGSLFHMWDNDSVVVDEFRVNNMNAPSVIIV